MKKATKGTVVIGCENKNQAEILRESSERHGRNIYHTGSKEEKIKNKSI